MLGMWIKRGLLAFLLMLPLSSAAFAEGAEKPLSDGEIRKFITDYPDMIQWIKKNQIFQGQINIPWVMGGMRYNNDFVSQLEAKGWSGGRFFHILDHLNRGLMAREARQNQQRADARMKEDMQKLREENRVRDQAQDRELSAFRKKMADAAQKNRSAVVAQLDNQERAIRNNPYMNPFQRRQALDFVQQQRNQSLNQPVNFADSSKAMQQWQEGVFQSQRQAILNNPAIPAGQKYWMIKQIKANKTNVSRGDGSSSSGGGWAADPEQARKNALSQQKAWVIRQKAMIAGNPFIPPYQRQAMNQQLQGYVQAMEKNMHQGQPSGQLNKGEMDLVEKYGDQLQKLFQQR